MNFYAAEGPTLALLHVRYPNGTEATVPITQSPFSIGRGHPNLLQLNDVRVSSPHATLEIEVNSIFLVYHYSTDGTFLVERQIPPNVPCPLRYGQSFVMVPYVLRGEPAPFLPASASP